MTFKIITSNFILLFRTACRLVVLLIFISFFAPKFLWGQSNNMHAQTAFNMLTLLEKNHYSPIPIDEDLSQKAWKNFINYLDPGRIVFLEKDIIQFTKYKNSLCQQALNQNNEFLSEVLLVYKERLNNVDSVIEVICRTPFNFSSKESIRYKISDSASYPRTIEELKSFWTKRIKHHELRLMINSEKDYSKKEIDSLLKIESTFREKVKKNQKRIIQRILSHPSGYENFVASLYMNSFATCFDPHTYFLTPNDKKNFESDISPESLSFGFTVEETADNEIRIVRIIPGSPAWKSNLLHPGDIISEIQWGDKKAIDISGASADELYQMLHESNSEKLTLTIKKINDLTDKVILTKEKTKTDENIVKGIVLNGEKKIGYITLPGFYTEWDNPNDPGCANDVAKEILKLKEEGIEGLILDIRSNGGGSLTEALNLAGIFIDEGPLAIYKERWNKPITLKDMNRGTVYNGPLIVMINAGSASASELISGCLQDYNRAVIVGNNSFGKATGQIILPNDSATNLANSNIPKPNLQFGFVITTTFKFYRILGNSHQLSGVVPDIKLPDFSENNFERETTYPYALPNDSIIKKIYYTPLPKLPLGELSEKSKLRCEQNSFFKTIATLSDSLDSNLELDEIPLEINSYTKIKQSIFHLTHAIEEFEKSKINVFTTNNYKQNNDIFEMDDYGREMNEQFANHLLSDALLEETFLIMTDLINLTNKK